VRGHGDVSRRPRRGRRRAWCVSATAWARLD
jgi:hypothetical protein